MSEPSPRTVVDPTTGRPILMAPQRQQRPNQTGARRHAARCPFCTGNEADTPPEVDAERRDGSAADGPGWTARAFANKYPATPHHEVVAEGAAHAEHPCALDRATLRATLRLWQRRLRALERHPDVRCAFLFKNVGARAGASMAHNHSQVIGLDRLPPRLELERAQQREHGRCLVCASLAGAHEEGRVVYADDAHAVWSPDPPKLPFETWLAPRAGCATDGGGGDFVDADVDLLADAFHGWFAALDGALGSPPLNLWLHRVPKALLAPGETFHWHFELQPRTGQVAGLELGGDMYINSVPAATSAMRLRDGLTGPRAADRGSRGSRGT